MTSRLSFKPTSFIAICAAMYLGTAAFAQDAASTAQNAAGQAPSTTTNPVKKVFSGGTLDEHPDLIEIDPFGGVSTWGQVQRGLTTKLVNGGTFGLRLAYNPSAYLGIELWAEYDVANVSFRQSSGFYPGTTAPLPTYSFGSRNYIFGLNPIINLKPRGSRVQPYLTVGVNGILFSPTNDAITYAKLPTTQALYGTGGLNNNLQVGLNYGGGVKFHLSDHVGLRLDARGFWSRNPTYGLPNYPNGGVYIPAHDKINGFQGTVGLVFYAGQTKCPEMPAAPAPPPPLPTPTISGAEGTICPGKAVALHAALADVGSRKLKYAWTVNGTAQGDDSPDFSFTPTGTGTSNIQVTVTDITPPPPPLERPKKFPVRCWILPPAPPPPAPVSGTTTITITAGAPTISAVTADPTTLSCAADKNGTHTANLTATATAAACGGNLTYKWTTSEGSITNDSSPNATFDASSLNFEGGAQAQTKTVTATLTVTDQQGQTATQTTTITVNCPRSSSDLMT